MPVHLNLFQLLPHRSPKKAMLVLLFRQPPQSNLLLFHATLLMPAAARAAAQCAAAAAAMRGRDTAVLRMTALTRGLASSEACTEWGSSSVGTVTSACRGTVAAAAAACSRLVVACIGIASVAAAGVTVLSDSVPPLLVLLLQLPVLLPSVTMLLPGLLLLLLLSSGVLPLAPGAVSSGTLGPLAAVNTDAAYMPAAGAAAAETSEAARTCVLHSRREKQ
jgi:hypothetical protein